MLHLRDFGTHVSIEDIAINPQVAGCLMETNEAHKGAVGEYE
jgi:hypothetical protein